MNRKQPVRFVDAAHIEMHARRVRDVAQRVIDACEAGTSMDAYAHSKIMGGSLAGDVVVLAIEIARFEKESETLHPGGNA